MSSADTAARVERELTVCRTFVRLADTTAPDFDLEDFLDTLAQNCAQLLGVGGAGIVLADHDGDSGRAAGSTHHLRELAGLELAGSDGPSIDCYQSGLPVQWNALDPSHHGRWQQFVAAARKGGYQAAHALPMRYGDSQIGALTLLVEDSAGIDQRTAELGQALTDVATIAILQHRLIRQQEVLVEQLQTALDSRIVIEQAKGILAERHRISVTEAFGILRGHARRNRQKLSKIAQGVIDRTVEISHRPR
ncbi:ANTAR domain-containing protein [Flindersiella endophytica]